MASALYDKGRQHFLQHDIDWINDTIKAVCVDAADYTRDLANHETLADIPAIARVGTSAALAGKTSTAGVADANDGTVTGITGDQFEQVILYKDSGVEATSWLIANIDTGTGLPFTPSGGDLTLQWDNGANKIFKL